MCKQARIFFVPGVEIQQPLTAAHRFSVVVMVLYYLWLGPNTTPFGTVVRHRSIPIITTQAAFDE